MGKADEVLRQLMLYHGKRIAKEVVGNLPAQMKQTRRDVRSLQKSLAGLTRQLERLMAERRAEAPVPAASEDEVEKARFTKRTLPALRKRFDLTQQELSKLLQVGSLTISSWERGKTRPRAGNVPRIVALRSMSMKQVDAALGRQAAAPAIGPQQIKDLRRTLGLSQGKLARLIGVSAAAVGTWEQGTSAPGPRSREALARIRGTGEKEGGKRAGGRKAPAARAESATRTALSPEQIRDIRRAADLSQIELADALGVSPNSVSNWETGSTSPRAKSMEKLLAMRK
jgi:DNA-binding transcriptional regulator YiaG